MPSAGTRIRGPPAAAAPPRSAASALSGQRHARAPRRGSGSVMGARALSGSQLEHVPRRDHRRACGQGRRRACLEQTGPVQVAASAPCMRRSGRAGHRRRRRRSHRHRRLPSCPSPAASAGLRPDLRLEQLVVLLVQLGLEPGLERRRADFANHSSEAATGHLGASGAGCANLCASAATLAAGTAALAQACRMLRLRQPARLRHAPPPASKDAPVARQSETVVLTGLATRQRRLGQHRHLGN
jgi:hypothetical protein